MMLAVAHVDDFDDGRREGIDYDLPIFLGNFMMAFALR